MHRETPRPHPAGPGSTRPSAEASPAPGSAAAPFRSVEALRDHLRSRNPRLADAPDLQLSPNGQFAVTRSGRSWHLYTAGAGQDLGRAAPGLWSFTSRKAALAFTRVLATRVLDDHGHGVAWHDPDLSLAGWCSEHGEPPLEALIRIRAEFNREQGRVDPELDRRAQTAWERRANGGAGAGHIFARDAHLGQLLRSRVDGLPAVVEAARAVGSQLTIVLSDGTRDDYPLDARLPLGETVDTTARDTHGTRVGTLVRARDLLPGDPVEATVESVGAVTDAVLAHTGRWSVNLPDRVTARGTVAHDHVPRTTRVRLRRVHLFAAGAEHALAKVPDLVLDLRGAVARLDEDIAAAPEDDLDFTPRAAVTPDKLARGDLLLEFGAAGSDVLAVRPDGVAVRIRDRRTGAVTDEVFSRHRLYVVVRSTQRPAGDLPPAPDFTIPPPSEEGIAAYPRGGAAQVRQDLATLVACVAELRADLELAGPSVRDRGGYLGLVRSLDLVGSARLAGPARLAESLRRAHTTAVGQLAALADAPPYAQHLVAAPLRELLRALDHLVRRCAATAEAWAADRDRAADPDGGADSPAAERSS